MKLRRFLVILTVAMLLVALPLAVGNAQKRLIRLTFYYPVGVSGPLATVINTCLTSSTPPTPTSRWCPSTPETTIHHAEGADRLMGGNPPDVFIVEISELLRCWR